jgi:uncharacterized protein VirK/YbjX
MQVIHLTLRRVALALARLLCGPNFAAQIQRFAQQLYPAAEDAKNATRFHLRSLIWASQSRAWFELLDSDPRLVSLTAARPHLAEKIHRPYLRSDYSATAKLAALMTHYRSCLDLPAGRLPLAAQAERVALGEVAGKNDSVIRLALGADEQFMKEGEFVVHLDDDSGRLYTLVAAIVPGATGAVLSIGCMQGPDGSDNGGERIKLATKAMHGLRPKAAMLLVAQTLAAAFELPTIVAVGNARHIYRSWRKRRAIHTDYDALWTELGGSARGDGDFELPLVTPLRPLTEFASNKRAEAQRRQTLQAALATSIRAYLLGSEG